MLGVRRESITDAAAASCGTPVYPLPHAPHLVLGRYGLEARACELYAVVRKEIGRPLSDVRHVRPFLPSSASFPAVPYRSTQPSILFPSARALALGTSGRAWLFGAESVREAHRPRPKAAATGPRPHVRRLNWRSRCCRRCTSAAPCACSALEVNSPAHVRPGFFCEDGRRRAPPPFGAGNGPPFIRRKKPGLTCAESSLPAPSRAARAS